MTLADKKVRIGILASLSFLLISIIRIIPDSLQRFYNIVFVSWNYYNRIVVGGSMYTLAAVGNIIRLAGVSLGIVILLLVWIRGKTFFDFKRWVAVALSTECVYYLMLIPSVVWLFALANESTVTYAFGVSYLLQVAFAAPSLGALAIKVIGLKNLSDISQLRKWCGIAFSGYVVALWANSVPRWLDTIGSEGAQLFFSSVNAFGALNAFVFMSGAVVFAVLGAFSLAKQKDSAKKWIGLSLALVGLHYTIYLVFSFLIGTLGSIWLFDVWTIPLLGLGISVLLSKPKKQVS